MLAAASSLTPVYVNDFVELTASPGGGWTWFQEPRAVEYNGTIYFGYIKSNGDAAIRTINATTLAVSAETILKVGLGADDHNNPTILIRDSDKRIVVFYTGHVSADAIYMRVSTNPEDISSFAAEVNLDSQIGGAAYTYPSPVQLLAETNDPITLFFREHIDDNTTALRFSKSTDSAATWSSRTLLFRVTNQSAYWKVASDGQGRIDFGVSSGHPFYDANVKIGHFYYEGGNYYRTDGTQIVTALPLSFSDVTEIHNGTPTSWIWDMAVDADGHPHVTYATWPGRHDARLNEARWTGSAWVANEVAAADRGDIEPKTGMYYTGGIVLDHEDTDVAYVSRWVDGQWEMFRYTTPDDGDTWAGEQLTYRSPGMNVRPVAIRHHGPNLAALWVLFQPYTDYFTFAGGTRGAAP